MERKGQAAMEFLMTYGWAILAAIIAIAVLAYFGVFSPGKYMPNVCTINSPLGCEEYAIKANSLQLVIRNGAGDSVSITNISVTGCSDYLTTVDIVDGGKSATIPITCGSTWNVGSKVKGDIGISFTKGTGTLTQTTTGTITGRVP